MTVDFYLLYCYTRGISFPPFLQGGRHFYYLLIHSIFKSKEASAYEEKTKKITSKTKKTEPVPGKLSTESTKTLFSV